MKRTVRAGRCLFLCAPPVFPQALPHHTRHRTTKKKAHKPDAYDRMFAEMDKERDALEHDVPPAKPGWRLIT